MERMWLTYTDRLETLTRGALAGCIAAALLATCEMAGSVAAGDGILWPWRMASSVVLGAGAFSASEEVVVLMGFLVHLTMAVAIGVVAAMLYEWSAWFRLHRLGWGSACAYGAMFGGAVWLVNFAIIAGAFLPWMWRHHQAAQFAFHLGYGAALGLALHMLGRYARNPP